MRILYIVTAFPRNRGDVITPWLVETIDRLRDRGVEVEVLAPSYRGLGDQLFEGIPVHRFRYAPAALETLTHDQTAPDRLREKPLYAALLPGYLGAGTLAAARLARSGRFDAIHAFWPLPHGLFGLAARSVSRVPLVSTFFGVELTWLRRQLPFLAPLVRTIIRRSDAVTVISSHTASEVDRLVPGASVRTIPFGAAIDTEGQESPVADDRPPENSSDSDPGTASFDAILNASLRPFQLLFVGRLVERKGVHILLEALARLRQEEDVRLAIVGDGPTRSALEARAAELGVSDIVEFTGFIDAGALRRRFVAADAFVLPAIQDAKGDVEGLGVVLIEALLHAVPVIASASGGIPDVVRDGETGLLVPPGDATALADAIAQLIRDRSFGKRLAIAGRTDVTRRFGWNRIVEDLTEVYQVVSAQGVGRGSRTSSASSPARNS